MTNAIIRRSAASFAMISIMAPLGIGIATAQDNPIEPPTNAGIVSLIQGDTANLTILKYEGDPVDRTVEPNGEIVETDLPGLEGVEFNVQRIGTLDPHNHDDWIAFSNLDISEVPERADLGTTTSMVTDADGRATNEFAQGFYYVTETPSPGRTTGAPFLVALPMTQSNQTEWNYDVVVQPKNQLMTVNKEVADQFSNTGDDVTYTITGDIPATPETGNFSRYVMVDAPPTGITLNDTDVAVSLIGGEAEQALETADFTVLGSDVNGNLRVTLTETGLSKLTEYRADNPSAQVQYTVNATVGEIDFGDADPGIEVNRTYLYVDGVPGDPDNPNDETDVTDDVEGRYTHVLVNKTGSDTAQPLSGAVFELYRCAEGSDQVEAGPLTVNGENQWTTDANGNISITGLQLDNYANGADIEDVFDYCLVEVEAPEGYELLPDPVAFDASSTALTTLDVQNVPDNGSFDLPETGEAGMIGLIVTGLAVTAGGAYVFSRKQSVTL